MSSPKDALDIHDQPYPRTQIGHFPELALEIREVIYVTVFSSDSRPPKRFIKVTKSGWDATSKYPLAPNKVYDSRNSHDRMAILRVSRQVNKEAHNVLHTRMIINLGFNTGSFAPYIRTDSL